MSHCKFWSYGSGASSKRRLKSAENGEKGRRSGFFQFSWHKCWFLNNDEVFKSNTESSDHKGVVHVKKRRQKSAKMVKKGAGRFFLNFLDTNADLWIMMKFLKVILQALIIREWYIHEKGAKRAPEMVEKGAGQVFFQFSWHKR